MNQIIKIGKTSKIEPLFIKRIQLPRRLYNKSLRTNLLRRKEHKVLVEHLNWLKNSLMALSMM